MSDVCCNLASGRRCSLLGCSKAGFRFPSRVQIMAPVFHDGLQYVIVIWPACVVMASCIIFLLMRLHLQKKRQRDPALNGDIPLNPVRFRDGQGFPSMDNGFDELQSTPQEGRPPWAVRRTTRSQQSVYSVNLHGAPTDWACAHLRDGQPSHAPRPFGRIRRPLPQYVESGPEVSKEQLIIP